MRRRSAVRLTVLIVGMVLIMTLVLKACFGEKTEVDSRVTSPDGKIDAVIMTSSTGGVGGSVVTWLYLVPAGAEVGRSDNFVISAMHVQPELKPLWQENRTVRVEFSDAVISVLKESWSDARVPSTLDHPVRVILQKVDSIGRQ